MFRLFIRFLFIFKDDTLPTFPTVNLLSSSVSLGGSANPDVGQRDGTAALPERTQRELDAGLGDENRKHHFRNLEFL